MSFQVWLQSVGDFFPLALVEEKFSPFIESRSPDKWDISGGLAEIWISDSPECGGFMVSRPPGAHHPFWKALLEIMRQTETVLYWLSDGPKPYCVVANEAAIPLMPADMVEALGRPKIVEEPWEFCDAINESSSI